MIAPPPLPLLLAPPLPALPTAFYPMGVSPLGTRPGMYRVKIEGARNAFGPTFKTELHYWSGKDWPTLKGNFNARGWCGQDRP